MTRFLIMLMAAIVVASVLVMWFVSVALTPADLSGFNLLTGLVGSVALGYVKESIIPLLKK